MNGDRERWNHYSTLPIGRVVEIKTITGLVRLGKRVVGEGLHRNRWGITAVHCWKWPKTGDLYAVAWREPTPTQEGKAA